MPETATTTMQERVREFWGPLMLPNTTFDVDPATCEHEWLLVGPNPSVAGPLGTGCRKCGWMKAWGDTREPTRDEWAAIKAALTPEQVERIKAKCRWEQMSWRAVYRDWPSLFTADASTDNATVIGDETTSDSEHPS